MSRQLWFELTAISDRGTGRERNEAPPTPMLGCLLSPMGSAAILGAISHPQAMTRTFAQIDLTLEGWTGPLADASKRMQDGPSWPHSLQT